MAPAPASEASEASGYEEENFTEGKRRMMMATVAAAAEEEGWGVQDGGWYGLGVGAASA